METANLLQDENGVRRVDARWVICADVALETPAALGGGDSDIAHMSIRRDRVTGRPLLTGDSLGGALRTYLADILFGYEKPESNSDIAELFGARPGLQAAEDESQSPLVVFDSLATNSQTELRDGVAIDSESGTAEDHKKFDFEVVAAGTVFPIRVELIVESQEREQILLSRLVAALEGLAPWEIGIGARKSRGLGRIRSENWKAKRYDLSSEDGWLAWLTSDWGGPAEPRVLEAEPLYGTVLEAVNKALDCELSCLKDQRDRAVATAYLGLKRGLLIRSPGLEADSPDAVHLRSGEDPALPGTSLAGAMRARALRVLGVVCPGRAPVMVDKLFGPRGEDLRSSRLHVGECIVTGAQPVRATRVAIDRATQGVVNSALFDEEPWIGGCAVVRIELRLPHPGEVGLLILLLKDLLTGDLSVGGTSSIGRGVFGGRAALKLEADVGELVLKPGVIPEPIINRKIHELWSLA